MMWSLRSHTILLQSTENLADVNVNCQLQIGLFKNLYESYFVEVAAAVSHDRRHCFETIISAKCFLKQGNHECTIFLNMIKGLSHTLLTFAEKNRKAYLTTRLICEIKFETTLPLLLILI